LGEGVLIDAELMKVVAREETSVSEPGAVESPKDFVPPFVVRDKEPTDETLSKVRIDLELVHECVHEEVDREESATIDLGPHAENFLTECVSHPGGKELRHILHVESWGAGTATSELVGRRELVLASCKEPEVGLTIMPSMVKEPLGALETTTILLRRCGHALMSTGVNRRVDPEGHARQIGPVLYESVGRGLRRIDEPKVDDSVGAWRMNASIGAPNPPEVVRPPGRGTDWLRDGRAAGGSKGTESRKEDGGWPRSGPPPESLDPSSHACLADLATKGLAKLDPTANQVSILLEKLPIDVDGLTGLLLHLHTLLLSDVLLSLP